MAIYAFQRADTDYVKIGVSLNVQRRLKTLQHAAGTELIILHQVESDAPYVVERHLHRQYAAYRSPYGEWFVLSKDQQHELITQMNEAAAESAKALPSGDRALTDEFFWLREPIADAFAASQLKLAELAALASVPESYVHRLMTGSVKLTSARVLRVAKALNLELLSVTSESQELVLPQLEASEDTDLEDLLSLTWPPELPGDN